MAVPFYSIDFGQEEWIVFLNAMVTAQLHEGGSIETFRQLVSNRYRSHYVTLLPSARMGFYMLLEALFKKGDEIIVSAMSFPLYVLFMIRKGIRPVFVDIEPRHYNIDPEKIKGALTSKTKAILVTHLFGHPAQMDSIMDISRNSGISVIEDCAQSYGSFFKGQETGTFGIASLLSCSVMKTPTTLGGGIFITNDKVLHFNIQTRLENPVYNYSLNKTAKYFIFNFISIMNSYPWAYSILSHNIFGLIKRRNPTLLRKILYSGFGLDRSFSLWERPRFSNYQAAVGIKQFKRAREMTDVRREHARMLEEKLRNIEFFILPDEDEDCFWNYQYYVIDARNKAETIFNKMYSRGIHLMREDVWDCTSYEFSREFYRPCPVASLRTPGLIRIPNNSLLNKKHIVNIGDKLQQIVSEEI